MKDQRQGIIVCQQKYTLGLRKEIGFLGSKPVDTLIEANYRTAHVKGEVSAERGKYQRLVGRVIYLSHTRPTLLMS